MRHGRNSHGRRLFAPDIPAVNDTAFDARIWGTGENARLIQQRFELARRRVGYGPLPPLDAGRIVPPSTNTDRVIIFDGIKFNDNLRWIDVMSEGLHPARPMPTCEDWRRPSCRPDSR